MLTWSEKLHVVWSLEPGKKKCIHPLDYDDEGYESDNTNCGLYDSQSLMYHEPKLDFGPARPINNEVPWELDVDKMIEKDQLVFRWYNIICR